MSAPAAVAVVFLVLCSAAVPQASRADEVCLRLDLRTQRLTPDDRGRNGWQVVNTPVTWKASETALLLCDVWDRHWSRGATERLEAMVPRLNRLVQAARAAGLTVIHAPSDTMDFYKDTPARQRMVRTPHVPPPAPKDRPDPPLPVDASDGGSDTNEPKEKVNTRAWSRQHPGIQIDQDRDGISDNGAEVYSFLAAKRIKNLLIMGVHTNMCVLGRSFAIKQMVRWGMKVALIRDLTDAMYNPARPPYVSHEEGTRLVIEYIEKFWCPTVTGEELLAACETP